MTVGRWRDSGETDNSLKYNIIFLYFNELID